MVCKYKFSFLCLPQFSLPSLLFYLRTVCNPLEIRIDRPEISRYPVVSLQLPLLNDVTELPLVYHLSLLRISLEILTRIQQRFRHVHPRKKHFENVSSH